MKTGRKITAKPQPDGKGHQVTYETPSSRKVHRFPGTDDENEAAPHGAGSFHDPDHHQKLMDRLSEYLKTN